MQIEVHPIGADETVADLVARLRTAGRVPQFCALHLDCTLDPAPFLAWLDRGETAGMGATSCLGAMTGDGAVRGALFCIHDAEGDYGTAMRSIGADPFDAARQATLAAMERAGRPAEAPALVWLCGTPGQEERLLAGVESVVGRDTPIVGGSAADNTVAGDWFVLGDGGTAQSGVAVGVLYPSGEVALAYQNGYAPTAHAGRVTRADGRRVLEIDGRPAAAVYADWTGGAVPTDAPREAPRGILSDSTFWPLGREIGAVAGVPYYLLAHPAAVDAEGAVHLFADVAEGEVLTQMTGSADGLTTRAGRVAALARASTDVPPDRIAGALMVYCGGCMLSVRDRLDEVVAGVGRELPGVPFAGVFTFGEQGPILGAGNRHGNLMISCIIFTS